MMDALRSNAGVMFFGSYSAGRHPVPPKKMVMHVSWLQLNAACSNVANTGTY